MAGIVVGSVLGVLLLLVVAYVFYRRRAKRNVRSGVNIHERPGDKPELDGTGAARVALEIHGVEIHEIQSTDIHGDLRWELDGIPHQKPVELFAECRPEIRDAEATLSHPPPNK